MKGVDYIQAYKEACEHVQALQNRLDAAHMRIADLERARADLWRENHSLVLENSRLKSDLTHKDAALSAALSALKLYSAGVKHAR